MVKMYIEKNDEFLEIYVSLIKFLNEICDARYQNILYVKKTNFKIVSS